VKEVQKLDLLRKDSVLLLLRLNLLQHGTRFLFVQGKYDKSVARNSASLNRAGAVVSASAL
jgi:hypothetical protein